VLKVGLVAPFEGWYRPRGYDALWAVRLAIQEANDAGGVAGHQVELVVLDDHLDPYWAVQRAREVVADPAVMAVVGCVSAATAEAARSVYSAAGLPLITPASVGANGDGVFVLSPAPDALARTAMAHIRMSARGHHSQGAGRVVLLYSGEGKAWAETLRGQSEIVAALGVDSPGWLQALTRADPDWVICAAEAQLGGEVLRQARDAGLRASFMGGSEWATDALRKVTGSAASGTWLVTGVPREEDMREARDFLLAYRALGGHDAGPDAVLGYDAARTLLAALEEAIEIHGYPTRQAVKEALGEVALEGVTGDIRFNQRGARMNPPIWVYWAD